MLADIDDSREEMIARRPRAPKEHLPSQWWKSIRHADSTSGFGFVPLTKISTKCTCPPPLCA